VKQFADGPPRDADVFTGSWHTRRVDLRVSRLNDCFDQPVSHDHPYHAATWCAHPEGRSNGWRWPDYVCMAFSDDGVTWTWQNWGQPIVGLGHGGDCDFSIFFDCKRRRYVLLKRRNIPTPTNWRHIRGIEVFVNANLSRHDGWRRANSFWLDRDGVSEKYRRQLYGMSASLRPSNNLDLGLATVLEYPKLGPPTAGGDVLRVYLSSSRDGGIRWSLDAVYAGVELLPLKLLGDTFQIVYPAHNFVTSRDGWHHLIFEARSSRHERRYNTSVKVGVASWESGRFVGLTTARGSDIGSSHGRGKPSGDLAVVLSRPFELAGPSLLVNVAAGGNGASCIVEVLEEQGRRTHAVGRLAGVDGVAVRVPLPKLSQLVGKRVQVRFTLRAGAVLFGFQVCRQYVDSRGCVGSADRAA
jgi:hypothetical protein